MGTGGNGKPSKGTLILIELLVIAIVLVVGGAGYMFLQKSEDSKMASKPAAGSAVESVIAADDADTADMNQESAEEETAETEEADDAAEETTGEEEAAEAQAAATTEVSDAYKEMIKDLAETSDWAIESKKSIEQDPATGHCYGIILYQKKSSDGKESDLNAKSLAECEEFCEKLGGHLLTINSEEEMLFVADYMRHYNDKRQIIGLKSVGGKWMWVNGDPYDSYSESLWDSERMSTYMGENVCVVTKRSGGKITLETVDFEKSGTYRMMCEWE